MDTPKANPNADYSGAERDPISSLVTLQALEAPSAAIVVDGRIAVENATIQEIENISGDDRRQTHPTPILTKTVDAEGFSDESRVDAEEESICHCMEDVRIRITSKEINNLHPVVPETTKRKFGFEMVAPQIWATQKIALETKRHQKRLIWSFLTMTSEPMPNQLSM